MIIDFDKLPPRETWTPKQEEAFRKYRKLCEQSRRMESGIARVADDCLKLNSLVEHVKGQIDQKKKRIRINRIEFKRLSGESMKAYEVFKASMKL